MIEMYIKMADFMSTFSYCNRKKVGCVIVKDKRVLSVGYNGTLPGEPNICEDCEGKTLPNVVHAEENAILQCSRFGISLLGADLYCTHSPCIQCAKDIINSGIRNVFYIETYDESAISLLTKNNVNVIKK